MNTQNKVIVIGGGAAGMMAAISAAEAGAEVLLFEQNDKCGKKLAITGKGRCNVTNDCNVQEFMANVPSNPRFLYSALNRLSPQDTVNFFEQHGVPLKVERGRRVFPISDRAGDIVRAMVNAVRSSSVKIINKKITAICASDGKITGVCAGNESFAADAVIVATGGMSYPKTGSDGSGFSLVRVLGHTVTPLRPSLVPITSRDSICPALQGLSLKNVSFTVVRRQDGKKVYEDFGEMMFTHFGLTGPMVLSASAHLNDIEPNKYDAYINLKPALDEKTLDARIISDFNKYANKDFLNALSDLLPQKLIPVAISLSGIDPRKKVNSVTKEERRALCDVIRSLKISLWGFRPISEAIITKGGVDTREINPKTMESKLCEGLYFAGEMIDVDAYTGGYNLQIAFSTGTLAGESAAWKD